MTASNLRSLHALADTPVAECDQEWSRRVLSMVCQLGFKYVCPDARWLEMACGRVFIRRGLLSDGATAVRDHGPDNPAFWAHDRLYLSPWAMRGRGPVRVSRRMADWSYACSLMRQGHVLQAVRDFVGLRAVGGIAWGHYRELEQFLGANELLGLHVLPHDELWDIRGWKIDDLRFDRDGRRGRA